MAASSTSTRRSSKKPLASGHFEWEDQFEVEKKIAASTLEIIEENNVAHVLEFNLRYQNPNEFGAKFLVIFKYLGNLEKGVSFYFDTSVEKQDGDAFKHLCSLRGKMDMPCPMKKNEPVVFSFPYIQSVHKLVRNDFVNNTKVKVYLNVYLDAANPPDLTEPSLVTTMQKLCLNEELSDFKIICDGQEFPCHKLILSSRSDVFKAMFHSDLKIDEDESTLTIPDIPADTMKVFLKFIYTDEVKTENIDLDLLIAADKYNIKKLVNICWKHLEGTIGTDNVMEIAFVSELLNNDQLFQKASQVIRENAGKVKKPEQWDQIKKSHPHIASKIMDLIIFEAESSPQG